MENKLYQSQVYGSGLVEKRLGLRGEIDDALKKYKPGPIHKSGKKIKIKNMQKKKRPRKLSMTIDDLEKQLDMALEPIKDDQKGKSRKTPRAISSTPNNLKYKVYGNKNFSKKQSVDEDPVETAIIQENNQRTFDFRQLPVNRNQQIKNNRINPIMRASFDSRISQLTEDEAFINQTDEISLIPIKPKNTKFNHNLIRKE